MSELKATTVYDAYWKANSVGEGTGILVYLKSEADKVIAELEESHKKEVGQLLIEITKLKADYKEACDRLQTANLIKDEQKAKADKLISCLKYLVMGDLIKDCPPKRVATEIVKEYDNGLG